MSEKQKCTDCKNLCIKNGKWYCDVYEIVPPLNGECYNW